MTDKEILQNLDKLDMELPFDEIYVGDKYVDVHEVLSEIKERIDPWHYPSKGEYPTEVGRYFCKLKSEYAGWNNDWYEAVGWTGECWILNDDEKVIAWQYITPPNEEASTSSIIDWMHDDITWCRRKCPNKECFRNQVNRRLKAGLISVADMYKEGTCPKEAE